MRHPRFDLSRLKSLVRLGQSNNFDVIGRVDIAELALRAAMADRRRLIRKISGARSGNSAVKVAANRFAKRKARELKKLSLKRRTWSISKNILLKKVTPSPILDGLDVDRVGKWKPLVARKFRRELSRVEIRNFNFLDDPALAIKQLLVIADAECNQIHCCIDFMDSHCLDVGAYLVLAEIWPQLAKVFRGGKMPLAVQKVLSAIHLDQELGIGLPGVRDHSDVWAFPIRHRRPRGTTVSPTALLQPQEREKVADEFCDLFDKWLEVACREKQKDGELSWELSPEGRSLIARMSGELLDNAERHSVPGSSDGDWSTTAFMAARDGADGQRELRCYFAFLSTGLSISEAMSHAPEALLKAAERYLAQFGVSGPSRDTLLTVLALQDAITSDVNARINGRGGTGLQDVLELVSDLGAASQPGADVRVTIVSGKSCVRLRYPNLLGSRDNSGRRVQWCNPWNDPTRPPDRSVAFDLPAHFAGTLVSVGFTLDPRLFVAEDLDSDVVVD